MYRSGLGYSLSALWGKKRSDNTAIFRQTEVTDSLKIQSMVLMSCVCFSVIHCFPLIWMYQCGWIAVIVSRHQTVLLCADHQASLYQRICVSPQSHAPQRCHCVFYLLCSFISSVSTAISICVPVSRSVPPTLICLSSGLFTLLLTYSSQTVQHSSPIWSE